MRKPYLDNIRWSIQALVVIYHVFYMYNAEGVFGGLGKITALDVQYYDVVLYVLAPWLMPILFLVAGVSARLSLDRRTPREFIKNRTVKLLVPSTLGLLTFQFVQGYVSMGLSDVWEKTTDAPLWGTYLIMTASGTGVLWFIQTLWLFSILLPLVKKYEKDRLRRYCRKVGTPALIAFSALIWGAAQILNTPVIVVYRFGFYGAFFLLGYFVFSHDEVVAIVKKRLALFATLAVAFGIAFCATAFGKNYADAPINRSVLFTCYSWFGSLALLGGAARYFNFETPLTRWMTQRAYGLYVFHYLGISSVALFIAKPGYASAPIVYLLSLVAGFGGGFLLNAVISRIPVLRWTVLGIADRKVDNVQR